MPNTPEKGEYSPEELARIYDEQLGIIFSGEPDFVNETPVLDQNTSQDDRLLPLNRLVRASEIKILKQTADNNNLDTPSQAYLVSGYEARRYRREVQKQFGSIDPEKEEQYSSYIRTWRALFERLTEAQQEDPNSPESLDAYEGLNRLIVEDPDSSKAFAFVLKEQMWLSAIFHQMRSGKVLSEDQRKKLKPIIVECDQQFQKHEEEIKIKFRK